MSISKQIIDILRKKSLSTSEISETLNEDKNKISVYITRLRKNGVIKSIGKTYNSETGYPNHKWMVTESKKRDFKDSISLLNFLNEMFVDNVQYLQKSKNIRETVQTNKEKFSKISKLIEKYGDLIE